jgi:hypothetical protein
LNSARRTAKFLLKKQSQISPKIPGKGKLDFKKLTGNVDVDGLSRYDLDFLEACECTSELFGKMMNDESELKSKKMT